MKLSEIQFWIKDTIGDSEFIIYLFVAVLATLLLNLCWKIFASRLHQQLSKTKNKWDDALLEAVRAPISLAIWGTGGWMILVHLFDVEVAKVYRDIALVILISWGLVRFIAQAEINLRDSATDEEGLDPASVEAISKLLRASVTITSSLVILQTLGVSISAVLAFGGMGGIAVGFAARDLLANFFGGLMIYLDRPFRAGDWIRSPDRDIEGTVEHIGWRQTRIRTFDKRPIYVPNSVFANIVVENPSRMTNRRIYETIGIRYDDIHQLERIVSEVKEMLSKHPDIDTGQTLIVNFNRFNDSSLDFFVYTFTKTTDWVAYHQIKQDVLIKIASIIGAAGAEIAYPTQRLQLEQLMNAEHPEKQNSN